MFRRAHLVRLLLALLLACVAERILPAAGTELLTPPAFKISGRIVREGHSAGTTMTLAKRSNRLPGGGGGPVRPPAAPDLMTVAIAPDGTFEFQNVPPGAYETRIGPNLSDKATFPVTVSDTDVTDIEWFIPVLWVLTAPVNFAVNMECECPLLSVPLIFAPVRKAAEPLRQGTSDLITGPFVTRQIPVGDYWVNSRVGNPNGLSLPGAFVVKMITADGVDLSSAPLRVTANGGPTVVITIGVLSPSPWVKVSGRVAGLETASVKASSITISDAPFLPSLRAPVNPDGAFEFSMVLPGTYHVQLAPAADAFERTLVVGKSGLMNAEIPMETRSLKVKGRLTDIASNPPRDGEELSVVLGTNKGSPVPGEGLTTAVAADGSFSFDTVQPGTYWISLMRCSQLLRGCTTATIGTPINAAGKDIDNLGISSRGMLTAAP